MDSTTTTPERYWVTQPACHPDMVTCGECGSSIDRSYSIPVKKEVGPLCPNCTTTHIAEHPLTPEYLRWLEQGDPRWWSPWLCNCTGCDVEAVL